jgi:hypothetical protein
MTSREHIRNPVEWTADQLWLASLTVGSLGHSIGGSRDIPLPAGRRIRTADLKDVLMKGLEDFGAYRSDVIFICLIYPLVGLGFDHRPARAGPRHLAPVSKGGALKLHLTARGCPTRRGVEEP